MILKSCVQTTKRSVDFLQIFSNYANIVSALMKSLDDSVDDSDLWLTRAGGIRPVGSFKGLQILCAGSVIGYD